MMLVDIPRYFIKFCLLTYGDWSGRSIRGKYSLSPVIVDCSQSPIFPCDRRDRASLTVNGGHLDF